jgi:predicted ATPase
VGLALLILRRIANGKSHVGDLLKPKDLARGRTDVPARFEIEAELDGQIYEYTVAFEFPPGFKELRVLEERLVVDGASVYTREQAQVHLFRTGAAREAHFRLDWHQVALPIIQEVSHTDPLFIFKQWLGRTLVLRPTPSLIKGESDSEARVPRISATNLAAWFSGLLSSTPAAYARIAEHLKQLMPDLKQIQNPLVGKDSRSLEIQFANALGTLSVSFDDLSDGEKCFMIGAMVLAANDAYGPIVCFWDEPDNYLAPDEVAHFVLDLRKAFQQSGQFIATSHNPEAIRGFSEENTFYLYRNSHLEPTIVRRLKALNVKGDLVGALLRGDVGS